MLLAGGAQGPVPRGERLVDQLITALQRLELRFALGVEATHRLLEAGALLRKALGFEEKRRALGIHLRARARQLVGVVQENGAHKLLPDEDEHTLVASSQRSDTLEGVADDSCAERVGHAEGH